MIKDGIEYVKCNECGRICLRLEMLDDKRMCKDCYIKWLETDFVKLRTEELKKKIKVLENKIADIKANCDLAIEGRDIKIKELEEVCQDLSDKFDYQVKQVMKLEQQIEKMKCCFNCKHSRTEYEHCRTDKHEKWEIKE